MTKCHHFLPSSGGCCRGGLSCTADTCTFVNCQSRCPYYLPAPTQAPGTASSAEDFVSHSSTTTSGPQDQLKSDIATCLESLEKNVNHPKRYTKGKIECIDALESAVVGKTPEEAICVANVIKYLWRYEEKEPLRSLKSAEWYLKRLISKYEANCGVSDANRDHITQGMKIVERCKNNGIITEEAR